jgi:hypothetical protein
MDTELPSMETLVHPDLHRYVTKRFPFLADTGDADLS